jgi:phenylacetic acid degradation operon negative regulatory protein
MNLVQPRAALLTLYGDYGLQTPNGDIGVGSLIELLGNFDLSEQAIRSSVSRMCRSGFLKVRRDGVKSYYSLTKEGFGLLETGKQRIFDRRQNHWNDRWNIVIYSIPEEKRALRNQLRQELTWLGFGPLSEATWISPNDLVSEVNEIGERLKIRENMQIFEAHQAQTDPHLIVSRCWDLRLLHQKYTGFINKYQPKLDDYLDRKNAGEALTPVECFAERFALIHEYRRLPFFDPDLPIELLPKGWLRSEAADIFHRFHGLLTEKAFEYFNSVRMKYEESRTELTVFDGLQSPPAGV